MNISGVEGVNVDGFAKDAVRAVRNMEQDIRSVDGQPVYAYDVESRLAFKIDCL